MKTTTPYLVHAIAVQEALPVRYAAYYEGNPDAPLSMAILDCDNDRWTLQFGVFSETVCVGAAALSANAPSPRSSTTPSWRLRGMAVLPEFQSRGVGSQLLQAAVDRVATSGGGLIWANIRVNAKDFYEQRGFQLHDDTFFVREGSPMHHYGELLVTSSATQ